jgi:hypothetical protein
MTIRFSMPLCARHFAGRDGIDFIQSASLNPKQRAAAQ